MSSQELRRAFEQAISNNPLDSSPRLIYADWLEENGFDDEAVEWRRRGTVAYIEAERYMRDFASRCGETCVNYCQLFERYREETRELDWSREEDLAALREASSRQKDDENWQPITYEMCIQAGHDWLNCGEYLVQMGTETARDLMQKEQEQFWKNWSVLTEVSLSDEDKIEMDGDAPFSCSC